MMHKLSLSFITFRGGDVICREKSNLIQWSILRPFKGNEKGQVKKTGGQEKASREEKARPRPSERAD